MSPKEFFENAKRVASEATPGPWHIGHVSESGLDYVDIDGPNLEHVAEVYRRKDYPFIASSRTQVPVLAEAALMMLMALEKASTATEDKFESCAHGWHSDWYNDILRDSDDYVCPICESSGFGRRIRTAVPTEKAKAASETLARVAELVGAG